MAQAAAVNPPQQSATPVRKVTAGGFAGLVVTLIVAFINNYPLKNYPIDSNLSSAITAVVSAIVAYLVPPGSSETTTTDENGKIVSATR